MTAVPSSDAFKVERVPLKEPTAVLTGLIKAIFFILFAPFYFHFLFTATFSYFLLWFSTKVVQLTVFMYNLQLFECFNHETSCVNKDLKTKKSTPNFFISVRVLSFQQMIYLN